LASVEIAPIEKQRNMKEYEEEDPNEGTHTDNECKSISTCAHGVNRTNLTARPVHEGTYRATTSQIKTPDGVSASFFFETKNEVGVVHVTTALVTKIR
jgi:hypothetical protein